jgi:broad specificity phosphatase PhoE
MRLASVLLVFLVASAQPAHGQQAIFLLRHAERVEYESPDGVLSQAGEARAQLLARLLKDAGVTSIYTTDRKRTIQTAEPLAKALGISPVVVGSAESVAATLDQVRTRDKSGVVVIVAHSNTVPAFLKALGHSGEIKIGDREHDDLFVIVPNASGPPTVLRVNY